MLGFTKSTVFFCSKQQSSVKENYIRCWRKKKRIVCRQMHPNQMLILVCTNKFKSHQFLKFRVFLQNVKFRFYFKLFLGQRNWESGRQTDFISIYHPEAWNFRLFLTLRICWITFIISSLDKLLLPASSLWVFRFFRLQPLELNL